MQLITQIKDTEQLMGMLYGLCDDVEAYMKLTGYDSELGRAFKKDPAKTDEENREALIEHSAQNCRNAIGKAFKEYPKETIELTKKFIVLAEGEKYPEGMALISCFTKVFDDRKTLDFFEMSGAVRLGR